MRFANLLWAVSSDDRPHYRIAEAIGCSETRFSRCLSGRASFTDEERQKLAEALGYSAAWLFETVRVPITRPTAESVAATA